MNSMEALIIIIVSIVCIGGWYLIYYNKSKTKYDRALRLYSKGNITSALSLLESIFYKHKDAPARIADIKFKLGQDNILLNREVGLDFLAQVLEIGKRLGKGANFNLYKRVEAKALFEIAQCTFLDISTIGSPKDKIKELEKNINFIDSSAHPDLDSDFQKLRIRHLSLLSDILFDLGIANEKMMNYIDAITHYKKSMQYQHDANLTHIKSKTFCRIQICRLKNGQLIDQQLFEEINKAPKNYKDDFYFRYVRKLIEAKEYHDAGIILNRYLNPNNSAVSLMNTFMKVEQQKKVLKQINDINNSIEGLYKETFSIDEIKKTYENLDSNINLIKNILPEIATKLDDLRPGLFNRMLSFYIEEKEFANAINLIQKYSGFWKYPEIVKNLGICSYGYVNQGKITEKNYKTLISCWLTAVYSDKVILKSLETTIWDDDYTFTLVDSIGSSYTIFKNLPENVNYNEISDNNISIGAAQRELLNNFEMNINKFTVDQNLISNIRDYYNYEKNAIERIISIIDKDILMAGPYFAITQGINEEIITYLDDEYKKYGNEDALEAGIAYLKGSTDTYVRDYANVKELVEKVTKAIENGNLNVLKEVNVSKNESSISKYKSVKDKIEDSLFNIIAIKIEADDSNESYIKIMEEAIKFSPNNEKLKYQYSNYVSNFCIDQVNDKLINHYQALLLMKRAYLCSPKNPRICVNFVSLISLNLMDILNDRTNKQSEIYTCLDEIYSKRTDVFKENAGELADDRAGLINQLKNSGVDVSILEGNTSSLTKEGEKIKTVLNYLKKLSFGIRTQNEIEILERALLHFNSHSSK
ncbi:MAG: hypothetical protein FD155_3213 [Bacteroidetes bacterium]|nr:MAG: hypothetical protein FD155_3213 [Bacteroidota bacterium]